MKNLRQPTWGRLLPDLGRLLIAIVASVLAIAALSGCGGTSESATKSDETASTSTVDEEPSTAQVPEPAPEPRPAPKPKPAPVPTPDELAMDELSSVQDDYRRGLETKTQPGSETGRVYGQWLSDTRSERPAYLPTYCSALLDQYELTYGELSSAIWGGFQEGCRRSITRFMSGPTVQKQTAFDDLTRAQLGYAEGLTDGYIEAYAAGRVYGQWLWDTRQGSEGLLGSQCKGLLSEYRGPYRDLSSAVRTGFREGCSRSIERR